MMEQRCSYCGEEQSIPSEKIRAPWAFLKCEACGNLSLLTGIAESNGKPTASAGPAAPPKPPQFVKTHQPASNDRAKAPQGPTPSHANGKGFGRKLRGSLKSGSLYAGLMLIALGVLQLSLQRFHAQTSSLLGSNPSDPDQAESISPTDPSLQPPAPRSVASAEIVDASTTQSAGEGSAEERQPPSETAARRFLVEVTRESAVLRSGPGTNYRRLGVAGAEVKLQVKEWRGDWFRVELPDESPPSTQAQKWIRNDLVKLN